ncbi:MAG: DUF4350 domain-containing protein [Flavobacteriaceae bacterium]
MSKLQKIGFVVFFLLLGILIYMEATRPVPVNWFPSYSKSDKIPLGTYVLHDLLTVAFKDAFQEKNIPPYVQLQEDEFEGTYLFINNQIQFDETEMEDLLEWTAKGNTLFISANYHSQNLLDTLNLDIETFYFYDQIKTEPLLNLVHEELKAAQPFHIPQDLNVNYFSEIDTLSNIVLGVSQVYQDTLTMTEPEINFLKIPHEEGFVYLHNQPEIFSNYFLLDSTNYDHTANVLSYINTGNTIYWDNYYKTGKRIDVSPLKIILNNRHLKWAYYFILIGVLLFVIFEGKRKQRYIPIIKPLANKTYEYTQTISGIYRDKKDNEEIAGKIISQFLDYIRTKLRVQTENINTNFLKDVAFRSGNSFDETKELFEHIKKHQNKQEITNQELKNIYNKIREFKTKADGK